MIVAIIILGALLALVTVALLLTIMYFEQRNGEMLDRITSLQGLTPIRQIPDLDHKEEEQIAAPRERQPKDRVRFKMT